METKVPTILTHDELTTYAFKQGTADANHRGPLLNGDVEIAAHPHREFAKRDSRRTNALQPIAQLAKCREFSAGPVEVSLACRHRHQAHHLHVRQSFDLRHERLELIRLKAVLRGVAGNIDFEQRFARQAQTLGDRD